jgi:hypothetical protein
MELILLVILVFIGVFIGIGLLKALAAILFFAFAVIILKYLLMAAAVISVPFIVFWIDKYSVRADPQSKGMSLPIGVFLSIAGMFFVGWALLGR